MLTTVVLTFNEERHLERCLRSVAAISQRIVVIDSFSTDRTTEIARACHAEVYQHPFTNQANQFNWALQHCGVKDGWVLRLDADETVDATLATAIARVTATASQGVHGYSMVRRIVFMQRELRHGGLGAIRVVRLFAVGHGRSESRWMDEHILVDGAVHPLPGRIVDHNLNSMSWWIGKHNGYASREVLDLLSARPDHDPSRQLHGTARLKRRLKHRLFYRLPGLWGPLLYFLARYFLLLGFLDGRAGLHFHFHQGFWYRVLVLSRLHEIRTLRQAEGLTLQQAVERATGYRLPLDQDHPGP